MRVDPTNTSIHDLTPKEAVELRALYALLVRAETGALKHAKARMMEPE